nr:MAG TPA_asm: hypothetical protein [Caudoviricetes sp.]
MLTLQDPAPLKRLRMTPDGVGLPYKSQIRDLVGGEYSH